MATRHYDSPLSRLMGLMISALMCFLPTAASAVDTLQVVNQIETKAYELLITERFVELNAMADSLRKSKERLPDGRWKLTFVTPGLSKGLAKHDAQAWQKRLLLMDKWIATTPDNATPYLAKAKILIAFAWDARGTGYANTVRNDDWPVFQERIAQAREVLEKSSPISRRSPLWYEIMQDIATAQGWPEEDFLRLFQEGVKQEPTYYFLYFRTAQYMLPRWHGSTVMLANFVDNAVRATEKSEGQTLYARIYWSLLWALGDQTFAPGYASWPRMKKGFEDIVRVYPDNWNLNAFAYYACMAQDWKTAKAIGTKLKSVAPELWNSPQDYQNCMQHTL